MADLDLFFLTPGEVAFCDCGAVEAEELTIRSLLLFPLPPLLLSLLDCDPE
jgi:hypothetical protein